MEMGHGDLDRDYIMSSAYHEPSMAEARSGLLASGRFFRRVNDSGWSRDIPYLLEPDPDSNPTALEIGWYGKYIWELERLTVREHNADLLDFPEITKPWLAYDDYWKRMTDAHPKWMCTEGGYRRGIRRHGG